MSTYRIGAPVRLRAFRHRYVTWALRGERRRRWAWAIYYFTPTGKSRTRVFLVKMELMCADAEACGIGSIAERVECAIVDRALRAAWSPAQGDA